jgi:hypothetical protein
MFELYTKLISYTNKTGPSSVKAVWLHAGFASVYAALLVTVGGVAVYCFANHADATYWASCVGLWTSVLGFASSVKRNQDRQIPNDEATR